MEKEKSSQLLAWYGVIASLVGVVLYIGNFQANTLNAEKDHDRRIEKLEATSDATVPALAEIKASVQYLKEREQERDRGR